MAKKNRISVGAWERIAKDMSKEETTVVDWHGEQLEIRRYLTLGEMINLVDKVIEDCFVGDRFVPAVQEFAFQRAAILVYTNLSLPVNPEKQYDLILRTDIWEQLIRNTDPYQRGSVQTAIDRRIEMLLDTNAETVNRQLAKISSALDEAGSMFDGVEPDDLKKLADAVTGLELDPEKLMQAYMKASGASAEDGAKQDGKVNHIELRR